ncbi:NAD(P)-binding domain-containing protein [Streptomyces sp. RY43-2]|uniref:NAD(P)-binding domain-containing protein n=1 Tax=Streptomyces macrolidinus TaxID=2952607 RepID=A0ABT0ZJI7_9ACTN|nr:NAD(P)-binding domain-containing protein [Streptomyces macrolidinus]MCN9243749.1 NAD(P)-binding domain-containing protein [Streptomyces macrolidinus]
MSRTVAFIGLGHTGGPMATNLSKAGHRMLGHDLVPAAVGEFAEARPLLEDMGKKAVHCGGSGAGQAAKWPRCTRPCATP